MSRTHGVTHWDPDACFGCKLLTVQFGEPTFTPHYNYAVGKHVSSWREFNDALKQHSDEQSARSGIESNYEPLHPADIIQNRPPESALSHLPKLAKIDADPTLKESMKQLAAEQERARQEAERAKAEDIIHDKEREKLPDLMPADA